jgi:hypothetical protein
VPDVRVNRIRYKRTSRTHVCAEVRKGTQEGKTCLPVIEKRYLTGKSLEQG